MRKKMVLPTRFFVFFSLCLLLTCAQQEGPWKLGTPLPKEMIKIGVIYPNEINRNSFYDNAHEEGILRMQQSIGLEDNQIIRKTNVFDGDPGVAEGIMRDCIAEGANVIIATSWGYSQPCEKLAAEFPSVIFIHSTGTTHNNRNFTNCMIRLHEARFLSGIAAGLKTESNKIGYVAAMGKDNSEVSGGINAFAIGVEEANPEASVYVQVIHSWYDPMGETYAANALIAMGCDVIAAHSNTSNAQIAAERAGVWSIGFNGDMSTIAPESVITSVVPYWGSIYTRLVVSIINGTFRPALHFYGLAEEAVDITPINKKLAAPGTEVMIEGARKRIRDGFNVFDSELKTNDGYIIGEAGKTLPNEIILSGINWYYHNVIEQ